MQVRSLRLFRGTSPAGFWALRSQLHARRKEFENKGLHAEPLHWRSVTTRDLPLPQTPPTSTTSFDETMSFDLRVVKTRDLPERFRPSSNTAPQRRSTPQRHPARSRPFGAPQPSSPERSAEDRPRAVRGGLSQDLPAPLRNLLEETTGELTRKERDAFLSRIASDPEQTLQDSSRGEKEWRPVLVRWLKEQANRFMAAAVQASGGPR